MRTSSTTVSELAFIFKLLPLLHEVDTIDRLYRLLLAIVTSGREFGYERAMLIVPDESGNALRGRYGVERPAEAEKRTGFDEMARSVFKNFEQVDATDLTVKVRSFTIPLNWHRSALVKAARTTYPVLADRESSEFATDIFFDFFGVKSYMAVPIEVDNKVSAVLAVDRSSFKKRESVDEISVLYSLVQQTAMVAERLLDSSTSRRKTRVLSKLHESLNRAANDSEFEEGLRAILAMICHTVGSNVCLLRDHTSQKTFTAERAHDLDGEIRTDACVEEGFEEVLELSSGTREAITGDGNHRCLQGTAAEHIAFFHTTPLAVGPDVFGALGVYTLRRDNKSGADDFHPGDKSFLDLCARVIASAMGHRQKKERVARVEDFLQEMSSNLVRERDRSRIGERGVDYHSKVSGDLKHLHDIVTSEKAVAARLLELTGEIKRMRRYSSDFETSILSDSTAYTMTDMFKLTRRVVKKWRRSAEQKNIDVTVRIADRGPSLLIEKKSVEGALGNILQATTSFLKDGDKVLVECSKVDNRVLVCIADNGAGLPGDAISRLFMPFGDAEADNPDKRALSLAGDVLQKHAAEVMIKSSYSWKTILVLSFPAAANRDRRRAGKDRRRRADRRAAAKTD
jgi:K+-sensing histidine kinase KdpD